MAMLGSRAVLWRIALNRCVTVRTPRSNARCASAAVASVWPAETVTPRATSSSISSNAPGSSGASVTWRHRRGVQQPPQQREVGREHPARVVHARPPRREERPFDVRAEDARADATGRHRPQRLQQRRLRRGHERRLERRRPRGQQRLPDAHVPLEIGGHQVDAREPVDLQVDEARRGDATARAPGSPTASITPSTTDDVAGDEHAVDQRR